MTKLKDNYIEFQTDMKWLKHSNSIMAY